MNALSQNYISVFFSLQIMKFWVLKLIKQMLFHDLYDQNQTIINLIFNKKYLLCSLNINPNL